MRVSPVRLAAVAGGLRVGAVQAIFLTSCRGSASYPLPVFARRQAPNVSEAPAILIRFDNALH